jgi:AhpD family alkylhydroperoxidase
MDLKSLAPRVYRAMLALDAAAGEGLEPPLKELVRIRASQLNGCVYCIDMHTTDARKGGERPRTTPTVSGPRSRSPTRSP